MREPVDGCWLFKVAIVLEQEFLDGSLGSRQMGGVDVELVEDKDQLCRRIRKRLDVIECSEADGLLCLVVIKQGKVLLREAGNGDSGFTDDFNVELDDSLAGVEGSSWRELRNGKLRLFQLRECATWDAYQC